MGIGTATGLGHWDCTPSHPSAPSRLAPPHLGALSKRGALPKNSNDKLAPHLNLWRLTFCPFILVARIDRSRMRGHSMQINTSASSFSSSTSLSSRSSLVLLRDLSRIEDFVVSSVSFALEAFHRGSGFGRAFKLLREHALWLCLILINRLTPRPPF